MTTDSLATLPLDLSEWVARERVRERSWIAVVLHCRTAEGGTAEIRHRSDPYSRDGREGTIGNAELCVWSSGPRVLGSLRFCLALTRDPGTGEEVANMVLRAAVALGLLRAKV